MREIENVVRVRSLVKEHHRWRTKCLPLMCAENVMSPTVREFVGCDFHHRYANCALVPPHYMGNAYIEKVESIATMLAKRLFGASFVELHAYSGSLACQASILASTSPGDLVLELEPRFGGFSTLPRIKKTGLIDLRSGGLPFNSEDMNIDVDEAEKVILEEKPRLVMLGATVFLFPHPVSAIAEAANEVGAVLAYDASHVLGLIAGRRFQDPLREGAFIVAGSTHKTLPGPQGGIVYTGGADGREKAEEIERRLPRTLHGCLIGNIHPHLVPALAVTFAEMLAFGERYADQIIGNSKALAQALYERGFDVVCTSQGFTRSHMILVDVSKMGGSHAAAEKLERANIVVTKSGIPGTHAGDSLYEGRMCGLRFGTQEVTRLAMGPSEMKEIAELCARALLKKADLTAIAAEVAELRKGFQQIHYCFDEGAEAYKYFQSHK